jgi:hypothetical protein
MTIFRALFLSIALMAGMIFGSSAPADAAPPAGLHRPCQYEDSNNCVWDARHMGNGAGRSFGVDGAGHIHYITHHRAHMMIFCHMGMADPNC